MYFTIVKLFFKGVRSRLSCACPPNVACGELRAKKKNFCCTEFCCSVTLWGAVIKRGNIVHTRIQRFYQSLLFFVCSSDLFSHIALPSSTSLCLSHEFPIVCNEIKCVKVRGV
ncbi:hypothetical protein ATANTOWER_014548 [Ataeniobius toweri]|uniref:Secreted protein n=1 Tax=Ataeniobius toweri TaxID=208326 RepID=A0ABU7BWU3_9TELE|nr:hypothetical protein [Ataeniobius toweri]